MKILIALVPIFINGVVIEPGNKFSCPEELAEKYVESKSASFKELMVEQEESGDDERKKLESLTKDDLLKLAEENQIEGLTEKNKKDEIIDALLKVEENAFL